jgi:hypothetical protein
VANGAHKFRSASCRLSRIAGLLETKQPRFLDWCPDHVYTFRHENLAPFVESAGLEVVPAPLLGRLDQLPPSLVACSIWLPDRQPSERVDGTPQDLPSTLPPHASRCSHAPQTRGCLMQARNLNRSQRRLGLGVITGGAISPLGNACVCPPQRTPHGKESPSPGDGCLFLHIPPR